MNYETLSDIAAANILDSRVLLDILEELRDEESRTDEQAAILVALETFQTETEDYAGDSWADGVTFIRDSYFQDYARELADDIDAIKGDESWLLNCIDWEQAARELQQNYTSCEIGGVTYWYH